MKFDTNNIRSPLLLVLVLVLLSFAGSDNSKDKEECAESLVGLATCLPYVGGSAKAPTSDCCSGLKQLLKTNKKCLCVVIKDRNDPDLGLNINATLALGLPQACTAPANISDCPALLKLSPDSPDAQIFYQATNTSSSGPVANVKPNPSSAPAEVNHPGSSFEQKSGVYGNGKRYLGFEIFGGLVLLMVFNWKLDDVIMSCKLPRGMNY